MTFPYSRFAVLGVLLPALLLAKPEAGESAHYRAVRERVGEGGQVFVYVDIDGYFAELGHDLTTGVAAAAGDEVTLQVASFANQQNAEHALSLLQGASIARAQLFDADVNGRRIWRLRIGPVASASAPELAARIVGLGFGQPQRVRE